MSLVVDKPAVARGEPAIAIRPSLDPLRIAMVGTRGVPATYGGVEQHVEQLGARLAARGHHVTVYCRTTYTDSTDRTYRGMHLRHLPALRTKHLEAISHTALAAAFAARDEPQVVHIHAVGPGLVSPLVRARGHCAVVQTVHGLDGERAKWGPVATRVLRCGEIMAARVPHETIVVSRYLADHFRRVHGRETVVAPNGIATSPAEPLGDLADTYGLAPGSYLLFVGRLVPEKRPDLLIQAFRGVDTDRRLVIAGGDSFSNDYVNHVRRLAAADPRVILTGYVYGRELNALYSNAAAFVLPSDLEGQGITLMEAASFGIPVVGSDIGPVAEMIGSSRPGALLFRAGDVDDLRQALQVTLLGGDLVRRGAVDLRRSVLERFSWDAMTDRVEQAYYRAVATLRR